MKKLVVLMLMGCLIFGSAAGSMGTVQVYAQDGSSVELADDEDTDDEELKSGAYTYVLDEAGNAILTDYEDKTVTFVTVPEEVDGHKVTGLDGTFDGCSALASVNLPSGITEIGFAAFRDCSSLSESAFPSELTSIGYEAFYGTGISTVVVPANVINIGAGAFSGCKNLKDIQVDAGNEYYTAENGILYDSEKTKVISSVTTKTEVTLPDTVTHIGDDAFAECTGLKTINLQNVSSIERRAFYHCSSLNNLELSPELTCIADGIFSGCSALTSINLPSGITKIGDSAFSDCSALTSINFPSGITEIESDAFYHCSSLSEITLPSDLTSIGGRTFYGCGMETISVPANVKFIGNGAFSGCKNLKDIQVDTENENYKAEDGMLYGTNPYYGTEVISAATTKTEVTLPDTVSCIGSYAFAECIALKTINLQNIYCIGVEAFSGCSSLNNVRLSSKCKFFYSDAFKGCVSLKDVYYAGDEDDWNERVQYIPQDIPYGKLELVIQNYFQGAQIHIEGKKNQTPGTDAGTTTPGTGTGTDTGTTTPGTDAGTTPGTGTGTATGTTTPGTAQTPSSTTGNQTQSKTKVTVKKAVLKSVKSAAKKALTVTWKKDASVKGYQVQVSLKKNFKSAKTVNIGKAKTVSTKIKGLKSGKKYYVRVRAYKVSGGTKVYGKWSAVKSSKVR